MWEQSLKKETYTVAEVAKLFNRDDRTVRRWIKEGKLYADRTGDRKTIIPRQAIIDFRAPPLSSFFR
jgi:excisionase family DNA binding protein